MTSQQLQTNRIHDKLKNLVDFCSRTGRFEDYLLEFDDSIVVSITRYSLRKPKKKDPIAISVLQHKPGGGSIKIQIHDFKRTNEWECISISTEGHDSHTKQILFDLPSKKAREICSDALIKKFVPKKFYNFLDNLNIDFIKTELV